MDKLKNFRRIMEKSGTDRVEIITNHSRISGYVNDCDECNQGGFVTVTNAVLCPNDNYYEAERCDEYANTNYDWLHVNIDKIVAFTFVK